MSVYVCLKQIPDVEGVPLVDPEQGFLQADAWWMNPLDSYALRGALQTAKDMDMPCVAVSAGGPEAEKSLRLALALGAERATLVGPMSPLAGSGITAWSLAGAIRADRQLQDKPDATPVIVFCGRQSADVAGLQVPYRLAACLGFSVISEVSSWTLAESHVEVFRQAGALRQWLRTEFPVVLALNRGQGELSRPTLPGLISAKKKTVTNLNLQEIAAFQPPEWKNIPPDPVLTQTRALREERICHMAEGETVQKRVENLIGLLRQDGCLP